MEISFIEAVYDSLQGNLIEPIPGVKNAFESGSECQKLYADMLKAYARICGRLGKNDEDGDVEVIINALLRIQKILCMEMYSYGARFGNSYNPEPEFDLPEG